MRQLASLEFRQRLTCARRDVADCVVRVFLKQRQIGCEPAAARRALRRRPAHALRGDRALTRVAAQQPEQRRGHALLIVVQRRFRRSVPLIERISGPRERAIEMTEIAGVRTAGAETRLNRRAADLMTANRLQQAVRRVRHVAVVAGAAVRVRAMMRMRCRLGMTLHARFAVIDLARVHAELIIRPLVK